MSSGIRVLGTERETRTTCRHAHAPAHAHVHTHRGAELRARLARPHQPFPSLTPAVGAAQKQRRAPGCRPVSPPKREASQELSLGGGSGDLDIWGTKECSWLPSGPFTFCLVFWETNGKKSPIPTFLEADLYKQTKPDNFQSKQRNSPKSGTGSWAEGRR